MHWKDICNLCTEVETLDAKNRSTKTLVEKKVFCNKKSVGGREFYQATQQGIKPELIIEIYALEYDDQTHVRHNNKLYRVIRSYEKGDKVELTCEATVNEQYKV